MTGTAPPTPAEDGFETRAIHAGQDPDRVTGAVVPPISLATTFAQDAVGQHRGFEYARSGNPTRAALEACLASLEGAAHGLAFASGLAAEDAVLRLLRPGDHVIIPDDAYGGTFRLIDKVWGPLGVIHTPVPPPRSRPPSSQPGARRPAWSGWRRPPTRPWPSWTSPPGGRLAHARGARLVVDNTFATPYLQQPLRSGSRPGGPLHHQVPRRPQRRRRRVRRHQRRRAGRTDRLLPERRRRGPGPLDCYLVLRGLKTLAVRMDRHCANAAAVVDVLAAHPAVARVFYPGLSSHPGHQVARRQMRAFGGMVSFVLAAGEAAAMEVARSTRLFTLAESLGAVESLIEHPHRMTHASAAGSALEVEPGLLRLSVGLETVDDLVADLVGALDRVGAAGGVSEGPPPTGGGADEAGRAGRRHPRRPLRYSTRRRMVSSMWARRVSMSSV